MAINLQKGQTINLDKNQYDLSKLTIGLGWKIKQKTEAKKGFLGKIFGSSNQGEDYDLDAVAFLLNENDKIINIGNEQLIGGDIIFFNNKRHSSGNIYSTGDNRVGGTGAQDDEQIIVNLNALDSKYNKIVFLVTIYQGLQKKQYFDNVDNAYIRAVDAKNNEIARYNLSQDAAYQNKCSMIFAEAYRKDGGWKFRAIGEAKETDAFVLIIKEKYLNY